MKASVYIPAVRRLTEILDKQKDSLSTDDIRHLNNAKNWLREYDDRPTSANKVNPVIYKHGRGGITI